MSFPLVKWSFTMSVKLNNALNTAFSKIQNDYNFSQDGGDETHDMWEQMKSIIKGEIEVLVVNLENTIKRVSANKSTDTIKSDGKPKKSHIANYYAYFHGCCSTKKPKDAGPLASRHVFKFRPENLEYVPNDDKNKRRDAQQVIVDLIKSSPETLESFQEFETDTISNISDFIENHDDKEIRNIDQMKRTSMIWWLFLTEDDRKEFLAWHNELRKNATETQETKPITKVTINSVKVRSKPNKKVAKEPEEPVDSGEETVDSSEEELIEEEPTPKVTQKKPKRVIRKN